MIRVLLIEDSRTVVAYVEALLRAEPDIEVLPSAMDGPSGIEAARALRPDVILMDLELPGVDGISAIEQIMASDPRPIVVLSAHLEAPGRDRTFESLEAGAVEVLAKPWGLSSREVERFRSKLLQTVRLMSGARVVGRWGRRRGGAGSGIELGSLPVFKPAPRGVKGALLTATAGSEGRRRSRNERTRA